MGYTASGGPKGLGVFNNSPQTVADLNQLRDLIATVGNYRGTLTEAQRDAITGAALYTGLLVYNTTASKLQMYTGAGWSSVWSPATAVGTSVTPAAGTGFTLSNNQLYMRDGWLLGSIDWAKNSGTLSHGDGILTLPVGARPTHDSAVASIMTPAPAQFQQLAVTSAGVVTALSPVSGRTGGSIRFQLAIPF